MGDNLTVAAALGAQFTSALEDGQTTEYYMLTLPLQATYDTRNDILNATTGFYVDTDVTPFLGLDQTDSGLYFYGDGRTYYTVGEDIPVTLAGRVQIGSIMGARLDRIPNDMRFFSGGGGTVRGQSYESLGIELNGERAAAGASSSCRPRRGRRSRTPSASSPSRTSAWSAATPSPRTGTTTSPARALGCATSPRWARFAWTWQFRSKA